MVTMIFSAPAALQEWAATHDMAGYDRHELRLPTPPEESNKAGLGLVFGRYLASFTIWGQGTTEWIIIDSDTGNEVVVEDASIQSVAELHAYLNSAVKGLVSLPK